MTPSLTQLAALVPLDPTTLVLVTIALLPARWTKRALNPTMKGARWLRVPLFALAALSLAMPVMPWPLIALVNTLLFFEAFKVATGPHTLRRRWTALFLISALWSLQTFRTFWQTFFEPDGRAHFWFVDFFNKLYLALIDPMLLALGGPPARAAVLGYLSAPVAFFSNHLLAMHHMASLAAALALTHVLIARLNRDAAQPLEAPELWRASLPPTVALLSAAALGLHPLFAGGAIATVAREVGGALLVTQGLVCLWVFASQGVLVRLLAWSALLIMSLHPRLITLLALLGLADSLVSLRRPLLAESFRFEPLRRQSGAFVRGLRRAFGPAILLLTLVPLTTFPLIPLSHMVHPAHAARGELPKAPKLKKEARSAKVMASRVPAFEIDRYEHPNALGTMPTRGLGPSEAEAHCRAEGKVLCESVAWYEACSNHGERFYLVPSHPYQQSALQRLRRECNLRTHEGAGTMMAAGAMPRCRGAYGVHDLAGNAYEWVRLPELEGFWGLAGSYYAYSDAQTPSCGFRVLVHERQVDIVDLEATGFRCCE